MAEYYRPDTLKKAIKILEKPEKNLPLYYSPRAKNLHDWNADGLVDLSELELDTIRVKKNEVLIGSMVSLEKLAEDETISSNWDGVLSRAVLYSSTKAMRNLATIGGVILNPVNPPEITLVLLALDAMVVLTRAEGKDHKMPLSEFLTDGVDGLRKGLLIREISIPLHSRTHCVMERVSRTEKDTAIIAVVVRGDLTRKKAHNLRIAISGAAPTPQRFEAAEEIMAGSSFTVGRIDEAAKLVGEKAAPVADFRGSAEYRKAMAEVLTRRALITLRKMALA